MWMLPREPESGHKLGALYVAAHSSASLRSSCSIPARLRCSRPGTSVPGLLSVFALRDGALSPPVTSGLSGLSAPTDFQYSSKLK